MVGKQHVWNTIQDPCGSVPEVSKWIWVNAVHPGRCPWSSFPVFGWYTEYGSTPSSQPGCEPGSYHPSKDSHHGRNHSVFKRWVCSVDRWKAEGWLVWAWPLRSHCHACADSGLAHIYVILLQGIPPPSHWIGYQVSWLWVEPISISSVPRWTTTS